MARCKNAEEYIAKHPQWQGLLSGLRALLLSSGLDETIKWGVPVYTLEGKNVVGLVAFKGHAALWFYQGALLKDKAGNLVNAQEGKTKAQRQWRFSPGDVVDEDLVLEYVQEAIANPKQGKAIRPAKKQATPIPPELSTVLDGDPALKSEFEALAPYKKREYAEHIAGAKQAATKERRLQKIIPMIRAGRGLNERYR